MVSTSFLEELMNGGTVRSKGTQEFPDRVEVSDVSWGLQGEQATWDEDEMGPFLAQGYFAIP